MSTALNRLKTKEGQWIRVRIGILCGLLGIGLGLVVTAGYNLSMRHGDEWREIAERQRQRRLHVEPKRGTLYDRNGTPLAVSVDVPSVSLDAIEMLRGVSPQELPVVARSAANRIAQALSLDPAKVERKILQKRRFTWLKRRISAEESDAIRSLSDNEQGNARIRGLVVEGEGRRYYPRRELAGPLIGFVAPDGEGKDGVEYSLDDTLKGRKEALRGLRDRAGRLIFADGVEDEAGLAGHSVELTIDQAIQFSAEQELAKAARTYEARSGSVVVVDPKTGEILAMASWPTYNPNDYSKSDPGDRRNRTISDRFEPGSTMKIFTVAAGLAGKALKSSDRMYCEKGRMQIDNVTIRDTHPSEWLTIPQVLAFSSNICAAKIGLSLGPQTLYDALRRFGFGEPTGVQLPGDNGGVLRPKDRNWVQVETAAASFGQGISITNLQLAMATAAIANDGKLLQAQIIHAVKSVSGEVIREAVPTVRRQAVPPQVAHIVSEMLVAVTEGDGTGTNAAVNGFQVAGKTATAQKVDPKTGRYSDDKYIASFVGFVPARNPEVVVAVTLDEPMVDHAGGSVAAPVFRRVAEAALIRRGMVPKGTKSSNLKELAGAPDPANATYALLRAQDGRRPPVQETVKTGKAPSGAVKIPDMTGWPMRRALKESYELGLNPQVTGSGNVVQQLPAPGEWQSPQGELVLVFESES